MDAIVLLVRGRFSRMQIAPCIRRLFRSKEAFSVKGSEAFRVQLEVAAAGSSMGRGCWAEALHRIASVAIVAEERDRWVDAATVQAAAVCVVATTRRHCLP